MDLRLNEEEIMLRDMARRFMVSEVEPLVPQMQSSGEPPRALLRKLGAQGLLGTFFPEAYGGGGASLIARAVVAEEMARMDAGLDVSVFAHVMLFARAINNLGNEAQKRKYLVPALNGEMIGAMGITEPHGGSDALSPKTTARKVGDHHVLNGSKTFITNAPIADTFVIIARTSGDAGRIDGGTWFILERGAPGLSTGKPFNKLGMRSSPTGEVFMQDVRVPAAQVLGPPERGFHYMMDSLDLERVLEGASTVGIAQACLDEALAYAPQRVVFGKPIASYQLVQEKIAAMAIGIELSRNYMYHLLRRVERGDKVTRDAAILKLYSSQMAVQAASDVVQIMGGAGYMEDNKAARLYRDAKHHEIGAGTSEIMKIIIARDTLRAAAGG
ncbi:MAG: acyl-CoA dehydrogenase family protein [Candidatus Lambdaproteobacteria bacterium]|nr:acyl-CoA dehydrogenase family protein [Candidatus Lambdaproteobacteria bacterium]